MALLDIFKKKKAEKKAKPPDEPAPQVRPGGKKLSEIAYRVLKEPHVTEKATDLTHKNQYVFKVFPRANKLEVRKAVEDLYGVKVISVQIVNVPPRKMRLGAIEGERKGYKKAVVTIKKGQRIEVLPR